MHTTHVLASDHNVAVGKLLIYIGVFVQQIIGATWWTIANHFPVVCLQLMVSRRLIKIQQNRIDNQYVLYLLLRLSDAACLAALRLSFLRLYLTSYLLACWNLLYNSTHSNRTFCSESNGIIRLTLQQIILRLIIQITYQ